MRTLKQQLTSKLNGQKSRGPVTAEGRARSSQNAVKHGIHAKAVVLANESPARYEELVAEYYEYWQPQTKPERDLVNDIVAARWRLNRLVSMETARIDAEIDRQRAAVDREFSRTDECTRAALAYSALADKGYTLMTMGRAESRLQRTIERATEQLLALKTEKRENEPAAALRLVS